MLKGLLLIVPIVVITLAVIEPPKARYAPIRDYPTWLRYSACRNAHHGPHYCHWKISQ